MPISTAVDASARARVLGIETIFKDLRAGGVSFLPQQVAIVAQGSSLSVYPTDKEQITSAFEAGTLYGFGSPIHLAAKQLFPVNGDGVGTIPVTVYPLVDDGAGAPSLGDITPGGAQTIAASYQVNINNVLSESFTIAVGDIVATIVTAITAAINANLDMPMIAVDGVTSVDLTSKWEGVSANELNISVEGSTTAGTTFAITQPVGGLVNPDVDDALNLVGSKWETMFLNCMESTDTVTLGKFDVFGEGRWGALVRKPCVAFVGNSDASVGTATTVTDARKTDRTNSQLVSPGSNDLGFVIAARQLARIAVVANNNPPQDYGSQAATGLIPGADADQWTYPERDESIKKGSSSVQVKDGVVNLSDTVTMYHPLGDPTPAYQYVCDIVKLQNIIYNVDLEFSNPKWDGAPLVPDLQAVSNRSAVKPKTATTALASIIDSLGLEAIISDPETAKGSIVTEIDSGNPKRLNAVFTVQLAGNANIISITQNFGFFFGTSAVVA